MVRAIPETAECFAHINDQPIVLSSSLSKALSVFLIDGFENILNTISYFFIFKIALRKAPSAGHLFYETHKWFSPLVVVVNVSP